MITVNSQPDEETSIPLLAINERHSSDANSSFDIESQQIEDVPTDEKHKGAQRIEYLEGLRGTASLIVSFMHFSEIFLSYDTAHYLWRVPILSMLCNGSFMVSIFFVLGGRLLAQGVYQSYHTATRFDNLVARIIKRPIRLCLPVYMFLLLLTILGKSGLFQVIQTLHVKHISPLSPGNSIFRFSAHEAINDPIVSPVSWLGFCLAWEIQIKGAMMYAPLWTIQYEFIYSFVIYLLALITARHTWYGLLLLVAVSYVMIHFQRDYGLHFIAGLMCCHLQRIERPPVVLTVYHVVIIVLGLYGLVVWIFYNDYGLDYQHQYVNSILLSVFSGGVIRSLGAAGIVLLLENEPLVQRLFSGRVMAFIGRISFAYYLFHATTMANLGVPIAALIIKYSSIKYEIVVGMIFLPCVMATQAVSYLWTQYVDANVVRMTVQFSDYYLDL